MLQDFLDLFHENNQLRVIDYPLDIYLEIPHLAYLEAKKSDGGKALLFTNPINKKENKKFDIPVLMNLFGSPKRVELIFRQTGEEIAKDINALLEFRPPKNLKEFFGKFSQMANLRHIFPKKRRFFKPGFQEIIYQGQDVDLYKLPILTTWEKDAAPFITMGQIYTQSLDGTKKNLGMYRLQVYDKNHLGLHWQIHKDGQHFFNEYKMAGKKMPVSIALGGDPLYTWCGQAPLPYGMYELMLYGFIRKKSAQVARCFSNPLCVPSDVDIVIEGWVDPNIMRLEGPFGDHTGFYTPIEPYPVLEVSAITMKKNPIFPATVVGKPPLEDKYMGALTERIFLPLLQKTAHGLLDYFMPENGVFHNLIFAKVDTKYTGHAKQLMHSFWGVGQMSFVKHAIFVGKDAPSFSDYEALGMYILDRFDVKNLIISEGVCDALDHSSNDFAYGGKLGVDATQGIRKRDFILRDSQDLLFALQKNIPEVIELQQYFIDSNTPICVVGIKKDQVSVLELLKKIDQEILYSLGIVFFVDYHKNDLKNPYMLIWRITNNIDAKRDLQIMEKTLFVDATDKGVMDGYHREWPKETDCTPSVLQNLKSYGVLEGVSEKMLKKFHICGFKKEE
ncbi:menaquinone biosynthesis decarboxylase [Helicobacter anatolicus]|uniref:menaquinone biosynthesis decarboxylase n=1 Tax=Helicobacter anatolicus TaxID=2905874 RepID=UPI001E37EB92|nr:menaquinone biosynthesis decarboxylase [Helicobacter anatolicus]MCE3039891.1 menaquinone biosynthesis decarboxylase [Helicobacter anatolicus]